MERQLPSWVARQVGRGLAGILMAGLLLGAGQARALPPPVSVIPLYGQTVERQVRDSRVCEVWATRKSAAGSDTDFTDVAVGSVRGLFDGMEIGAWLGSAETGAIVGLGVGASFGAWQAMGKQELRTSIYANCMTARGYDIR